MTDLKEIGLLSRQIGFLIAININDTGQKV